MIEKKELGGINKRIKEYDSEREMMIKSCRDILKLSKQIIFSLHRGDIPEEKIAEIKEEVQNLRDEKFSNEGFYRVAMQEYVEAMTFYTYLKEKRLVTQKECKVSDEEYLLGIMDVPGEIYRYAMNSSIDGNHSIAKECKGFLDGMYKELLKFEFRSSDLRKKFDSIKYNLQKLEELVFNLRND